MAQSFDLPGNPGQIRAKAAGMRSRGRSFVEVAGGLEKISTDGWVSRSADMFREQFDLEPVRWRDAGNGFVRAAGVLEVYAGHLESAQQTAGWAAGEYARGDRETDAARTAYDADVRRGQAEKARFEAQGGTYTLTILPFSDPGEPIRASAVKAYTDARTGLDGFGHTAADEVRGACSGAPAHRNWLESGLAFVGDVFVGVFEAVVDLGKLAMLPMTLLNDLTSDLAALATGELTPEELATKYQLKAEDAQALFTAIKEHPGDVAIALGKAVLDWDTWADDPAKAIGHVIPDLVVTIATLGGGAAIKGMSSGAKGLEAAGDIADIGVGANRLAELKDMAKFGDGLPPGKTTGWSGERGSLSPDENSAAERFLQGARDVEPRITEDMDRIARQSGGHLEGLDHRLKEGDSFRGNSPRASAGVAIQTSTLRCPR